jgi:hypothetical protein
LVKRLKSLTGKPRNKVEKGGNDRLVIYCKAKKQAESNTERRTNRLKG